MNIKKNIKLQPVPMSMPSEALSVRISDNHNASSGIDGGTGCSFIFFPIAIVCSYRVMSRILVQIFEFKFELFICVDSEKPPMCHNGDTMCRINDHLRR